MASFPRPAVPENAIARVSVRLIGCFVRYVVLEL